MSDPNLSSPTPTPAPTSSSEVAELKQLCADLCWQTHTLRLALLVVATSVCAFFWLEGRRNGQALKAIRPQAAQVIEASKVQDPAANKFIGQLLEFGKAHPDFAPVLTKYGIRENAVPAPAATPVAAPVPVAPKK
jgi:hypothetical protein